MKSLKVWKIKVSADQQETPVAQGKKAAFWRKNLFRTADLRAQPTAFTGQGYQGKSTLSLLRWKVRGRVTVIRSGHHSLSPGLPPLQRGEDDRPSSRLIYESTWTC